MAWKISAEKSADIFIRFPVYVTVFFSLDIFKILYHFFCHFNYLVFWCGLSWLKFWESLCLLYLDLCFSPQIWEFFSYYFWKYIFCLPFSLFSFWYPSNMLLCLKDPLSSVSLFLGHPRWLSCLALPSAQVMILETRDRVPCRAPCMEPASPSASLSLSWIKS